jgi:hypothetical protein
MSATSRFDDRRPLAESNRLPKSSSPTANASDCGDRELRFPRPGFGEAVAAGAGLHNPLRAGGDHQWVGGDPVHDRLRPVRRCHDQDRGTASLVRPAGRGGRPGPPAGFRDSPACLDRCRSRCLGAGLGWASCRLWQTPTAAIETVRRGGMVSLSGAYGGIAIPCR